MIAVSDTSPICYLILIGEIELLPKLFGQIQITPAVLAELLHEAAPPMVRQWATNLPSWIAVKAVPFMSIAGLEKLQTGEQSGILLAECSLSGVILLDEKAARRIATNRGLQVTGILGVLEEAATEGLIDLAQVIDRLRTTNFRSSPSLLKSVLDRHGNR